MPKPLKVLIQYCCPQRTLTRLVGILAECRWRWFKNWAIRRLIRKYHVNLHEALIENVDDYPTFNSFFTRRLKPELRPIASDPKQVISPVDGCISQMGDIENDTIFQAKNFYFSAKNLLGGNADDAQLFQNGKFATMYLAPRDYHRVHMPLTGKLLKSTFIPGQLFSVNQLTTHHVPNLFGRNERLVCFFETEIGPMAVILVGAMLVGSIKTVWQLQHPQHTISTINYPDKPMLKRGDDLGYFQMGSTVILLFGEGKVTWEPNLQETTVVQMGQAIGTVMT